MKTRHAPALLAGGLLGATLAAAQPLPAMELRSCVPGSPPLRAGPDTARAALDSTDRLRLHEAAQARYPLYQRGGIAPAQVLMLQRHGQWQYVALASEGGQALCVLAVFAAERFDFTEDFLARYRPREGEAAD